jgi:hypothetical protein
MHRDLPCPRCMHRYEITNSNLSQCNTYITDNNTDENNEQARLLYRLSLSSRFPLSVDHVRNHLTNQVLLIPYKWAGVL